MDKDRGRKGGRQNLKAIWRERDGGREREKERYIDKERERILHSVINLKSELWTNISYCPDSIFL